MGKVVPLSPILSSASYDPKKGWSTTVQPIHGFNASDYREIAEAAAPNLISQLREILEGAGFSYIEIPAKEFSEYEKSPLSFREWFEGYCDKYNLGTEVDLALVGPNIKTDASCNRKTIYNRPSPERNVDYLRAMIVAIKQKPHCRNKHSLDTLGRAINVFEDNEGTLARKNHYYDPHSKTGFRGHKTLRLAHAPDDPEMQILTEIKIEHESQMGIDKLTRKFIELERNAARLLPVIYTRIARSRTAGEITQQSNIITGWGKQLYDRVFTDAGISRRFLNPRQRVPHTPLEWEKIIERIENEARDLRPDLRKRVLEAVCSSEVLTNKTVPNTARTLARKLSCH